MNGIDKQDRTLSIVITFCSAGAGRLKKGRVRIRRVDGTVEFGIFQSASAQGVQLRPAGGRSTRSVISLDEIKLMERNLGRHGDFGKNFVDETLSLIDDVGSIAGYGSKDELVYAC